MKRQNVLEDNVGGGRGVGRGAGGGRRASHPIARGSVGRSGEREGDAEELRDHLPPRGLQTAGIYRREDAEVALDTAWESAGRRSITGSS